jgi:mannose-6-phosphate isomerase
MIFYPLQFEPILKERIWGGSKLKTFLNKSIENEAIGESWEISNVPDNSSSVVNGIFKGKSLSELIKLYPNELLGSQTLEKYGEQFPLLFKFIDAKEDLSIQLHPNNELAQKRHQSFGKTEMWYVMQADENARLIVGFKENTNQEKYLKSLENKSLVHLLQEYPVKQGDVFFLETGTIHAIGAGVVVAEIQQTSDITYRVYDWDRVDANGKGRELHTELALEAINYNKTDSKIHYKIIENQLVSMVKCSFFTTKILELTATYLWQKKQEAFTVFMCTEGHFELQYNEEVFQYKKGDTLLIPAIISEITLKGTATLLEISI